MTPEEIIAQVDEIKPNAFDDETKLRWVGELEGKIAADLFLLSSTELQMLELCYPEGMQKELLVKRPHTDIYDLWLQAKIDFANGEYKKYQNTMAAYNEAYNNFANWFIRTYTPAQGHRGVH